MTKKVERPHKKRGRKAFEFTEEVLQKVTDYASEGLAQFEIYGNLGVSRNRWFLEKKKNTELAEALRIGQELAIDIVENSLFKRAREGESDTSIIFYLKNRAPSKWARNFDKPQSAPVPVQINTSLPYDQQIQQMNSAAMRGDISWDTANNFTKNMADLIKVKSGTDFEERIKQIELDQKQNNEQSS